MKILKISFLLLCTIHTISHTMDSDRESGLIKFDKELSFQEKLKLVKEKHPELAERKRIEKGGIVIKMPKLFRDTITQKSSNGIQRRDDKKEGKICYRFEFLSDGKREFIQAFYVQNTKTYTCEPQNPNQVAKKEKKAETVFYMLEEAFLDNKLSLDNVLEQLQYSTKVDVNFNTENLLLQNGVLKQNFNNECIKYGYKHKNTNERVIAWEILERMNDEKGKYGYGPSILQQHSYMKEEQKRLKWEIKHDLKKKYDSEVIKEDLKKKEKCSKCAMKKELKIAVNNTMAKDLLNSLEAAFNGRTSVEHLKHFFDKKED